MLILPKMDSLDIFHPQTVTNGRSPSTFSTQCSGREQTDALGVSALRHHSHSPAGALYIQKKHQANLQTIRKNNSIRVLVTVIILQYVHIYIYISITYYSLSVCNILQYSINTFLQKYIILSCDFYMKNTMK